MPDPLDPTVDATLDPPVWDDLARLGRTMVDDMMQWLATQRQRPLHGPVPAQDAARFERPLPREGTPAADVYREFREGILPYPHGNVHPRFWGWVQGCGTPMGMLAELLAGGVNPNSGFGDQCAMYVERQVLAWLREALRFPSGPGGGVLTSGCTVANLAGLTVARNRKAGRDVREEGIQGDLPRLTVYGSCETHSSIHRACEVLGLGRRAFRAVPTDGDHGIRIGALREMIANDRAEGVRPVAIVGNAGTVNIGAFDDLDALADLARDEHMWLHVDGAFGAFARLLPGHDAVTRGFERADSVAFDLHKWMHVPYDAGAVLFRDVDPAEAAFSMQGAYLSEFSSTLASGPANYMQHGLQMSRGFRALKIWMTFLHYGTDRLAACVERNVNHARHLADLVDASPNLERVAPVPLNIVNFRYVPAGRGLDEVRLDALNAALLAKMQTTGFAAPSHTVIDGRFVMRAAITNHRTRFDDFDAVVAWLEEHGPGETPRP